MIQQALSAINTAISENPAAYARQVDEAYSRQLLTIARQIYNTREEKPIILLAGPSEKITSLDERYLKAAENELYGELSLILGLPKSQMEDFICRKLEA